MPVVTNVSQLAELHPSAQNGQVEILRVGTGAGAEDIALAWHEGASRWVEVEESELFISNDQLPLEMVGSAYQTKQELKHSTAFETAHPAYDESPLWGFASPRSLAAKCTAGLTLIYRHLSWMRGSNEATPHNMNVGLAMFEVDAGDALPELDPANAWAETAYLNGGLTWSGGIPAWQLAETGYQQLLAPGGDDLATPTKSGLHIVPFGFMDAGAAVNGAARGYQAYARWASP